MTTVRFSMWVEVPDVDDFDDTAFHKLLTSSVPGYIDHEWEEEE